MLKVYSQCIQTWPCGHFEDCFTSNKVKAMVVRPHRPCLVVMNWSGISIILWWVSCIRTFGQWVRQRWRRGAQEQVRIPKRAANGTVARWGTVWSWINNVNGHAGRGTNTICRVKTIRRGAIASGEALPTDGCAETPTSQWILGAALSEEWLRDAVEVNALQVETCMFCYK